MAVQRLYPHGFTAGVGPRVNDHKRVPRGKVTGWSAGATRRNTRFLYSVEDGKLTGSGLAVTLTVRECPESAQEWHKMRRAWVKRMERLGMVRLHWITEWQRRGVPHLHAAVYFHDAVHPMHVMRAWVDVAEKYGAGMGGQHVTGIVDAIGWRKYVSKHASRGVKNYQRADANIPPGWAGETGRVWGTCGDWPTREPIEIRLQGSEGDGGWFAFRRLVRGWRRSSLRFVQGDKRTPESLDELIELQRAHQDWKRRIVHARLLLKCNERGLSEVRGLSEWMELDDQLRMLDALRRMGYSVES